ncbi:hypothetical protein HELRODRAFT_183816 [Helobdella robusta]|uniref:Doublecortin domain-containing protein n=1 Tax=Helobdella robusta TaxID=6412 RepID=T1FK86_HELRO|nr:hypothetical protein HELRODRAFT_183816 [Helobdella robusta]ESO09816.1 hypothetical protein HELRODRAFT_183816 [Helobdella robusta]
MIKKVKFIRNGDNFYPGLTYTVSPLRHKTLDSLLDELTDTTLCDKRILPKGVRYLFTYEGFGPIETLEELYDGETYICSSTKTINSTNRLRQHHHNQSNLKSTKLILLNNSSSLNDSNNTFSSFGNNNNASSLPSSPLFSKRHWRCCKGLDPGSRGHINDDLEDAREFIKPRLITVIRNGARPRKLVKVLLNKKTALSMEQALNEINTSVKLDSGPLKKVYMANGKPVSCLKDFFGEESLFFAYGNEKFSKDDLELTASEIVQATSANKQAAGTINTSWTLFNGKSTPTEDSSPTKPHTSESQPDAFKVNDVSTVKKDRASVKTSMSNC